VTPAFGSPISRIMRSLMPDTLGARLVLTVVLLALATTATTIGINALLIAGDVETWARDAADSNITGFMALLDNETNALAIKVDRYASEPAFASAIATKDTTRIATDYVEPILRETGATSIVVQDELGQTIYTRGTTAEINKLEGLAASALAKWTSNFVSGITFEQTELVSEGLVVIAMGLLAAYFYSVNSAMQAYLTGMKSEQAVHGSDSAKPEEEQGA